MPGPCPVSRLVAVGIVFLAGIESVIARADEPGPARSERQTWKLQAAGHEWTYHVHVPRSYESSRPVPVVLVLHGGGGSGETYLDRAGWGAKANEAGFLAVAPDALPAMPRFAPNFLTNPRLWNTGQLKPQSPRSRIDDRAFFQSLLDDVARRWDIDPDRIYLTGHSNGAGMTFRLGAEMSERFAALAPVASHVWIDNPQPKHPRPTLYLIGTEDPLVPLAGGETTLPWGKRTTPPVSQTLQRWARAIGCDPEGKLRSDENGVKIVDYGPGRRGATLTAYFLSGHGHGWPGGSDVLPERLIGPSATSIKATDLIWEFFRDKTRSD